MRCKTAGPSIARADPGATVVDPRVEHSARFTINATAAALAEKMPNGLVAQHPDVLFVDAFDPD